MSQMLNELVITLIDNTGVIYFGDGRNVYPLIPNNAWSSSWLRLLSSLLLL